MKNTGSLLAAIICCIFSFNAHSQNSVLANGTWYKLSVSQTGIHRITYSDLVNYGIDPASLNPKNIRIFGNGNGMLPEDLSEFRYEDLQENAIRVMGEDDGTFDPGDYILFYGVGPVEWKHDATAGLFTHQVNYYSEATCYFLNADIGPGKRIEVQSQSIQTPTHQVSTFDDFTFYEWENVNLIQSGKKWFGEYFEPDDVHSFNLSFNGLVLNKPVLLKTSLVAKSSVDSHFEVEINGSQILSPQIIATNPTSVRYARLTEDTASKIVDTESIVLDFTYFSSEDTAKAWLDYFALNFQRFLDFYAPQVSFRNTEAAGSGNVADFTLTNATSELNIWNVTDPISITNVEHDFSGTTAHFVLETDSLLEFIMFDGSVLYSPEFVGQVGNQNLHGIAPADYLVISHPEFLPAAQQLANWHQVNDGMDYIITTPAKIYNEFSSGVQDVTAIRDFVKYMYDKSDGEKPKYLLLMGDASYDYLDRVEDNTNHVPVHETEESLNLVNSIATDDFYGLLDPGEWKIENGPDIAIGRLPVKTAAEASILVDKLIHYAENENMTGKWKNEATLIADDEDGNLHLQQAEDLVDILVNNDPVFNIEKLYFDLFPQALDQGEQFYPEIESRLEEAIEEGRMVINYTGHGGWQMLAQEQVLSLEDIEEWENYNRLPLFISATGDFSHFDDPAITSIGELMIQKSDGGASGVISPVRVNYAQANFAINSGIFDYLSNPENYPVRMGDLLKFAKGNSYTGHVWNLLGDPALKLPIPELLAETTTINGIPAGQFTDTIHPNESITIEGNITDQQGNQQNTLNGNLTVTIYERAYLQSTLGNDPGSQITDVLILDSVMAEVESSVTNGSFVFDYTLPYNLSEQFAPVKISYYASLGGQEARGAYKDLIIGGEPSGLSDKTLDYLSVYPTITNEKIYIKIGKSVSNLSISWLDITGRQISHAEYGSVFKGTKLKLDIRLFDKGLYFLVLQSAEGRRVHKVMKN